MDIVNKKFHQIFYLSVLLALTLMLVGQSVEIMAQDSTLPEVTILRTPENGIQPQAVKDSVGTIHLIFYKGEAEAGDIFYVRLTSDGKPLTTPIRVNSQPNSAIAKGWVRGAQIAIGKNNRVHIIWNGSGKAAPKVPNGGPPMLYTRLNDTGTAFEPQRNLITWAGGIDGGGALAADNIGNVYVFWHANVGAGGDAERTVFKTRSINDGKTFSREEKVNLKSTGVCSCCAMKAFIDNNGILYLLYRAAGDNINRDTTLLISRDKAKTFESSTLARWKLEACPLSVYSITQGDPSAPVIGAWVNQDQVYFAKLSTDHQLLSPHIFPSGTGNSRKYPVITADNKGNILFAWLEGAIWGKGGSLVWQVFDKTGSPLKEKGRVDGVPVWSLLTAFSSIDGRFVLIY